MSHIYGSKTIKMTILSNSIFRFSVILMKVSADSKRQSHTGLEFEILLPSLLRGLAILTAEESS